jgi:carbon storage regulator
MLVLTRKLNESIILNDNIKVTVVEIKGGKVRLGIEAPRGVSVDREEIHSRRQDFVEVDLAVLQE